MKDFHPRSSRWLAGLTLFIGLMTLGILARLYYVSLELGPELVAASRDHVIQEREIPASRGNIYSSDGQLLATSMPVYELHWDAAIVDASRFQSSLEQTCEVLAAYVPEKSASEWNRYLRQQFSSKSRYALISKGLSYSQYRKVSESPLFEGDKYQSGFIVEEEFHRLLPYGDLGSRTIGYHRTDAAAGLEAHFQEVLKGQSGKRWMQNLGGDQWKPIESSYTVEPKNGSDIVVTLDSRMQDVANRALLKGLMTYDADHGSVILMEVKTGKIRAMANLGRTSADSSYRELRNYAVWEKTEPGSTFKTAALLIGLEDGVVDTSEIIDTSPGVYYIYGDAVTDSRHGGYGNISLGTALIKSSNTGIVKPLYREYVNKPEDFIDRMYQLGLANPTGIQVPGESSPFIPKVGEGRWSKTTLPWMFYGYTVESTPLQTLTFYNAIANHGEMVAPTLWEETRSQGQTVSRYEKKVLHPAIASQENLKQIQDLLEKVVIRGTASNIHTEVLRMAGKTGTCQLNYWDKENMGYQASFAGYFPADDPQYSCIVVVNRPNKKISYFANKVAAPIFQELALEVNRMTPQVSTPAPGYWRDGIKQSYLTSAELFQEARSSAELALQNGSTPEIIGWTAGDAIALLESHGHEVKVIGNGRVVAAKREDNVYWLELG